MPKLEFTQKELSRYFSGSYKHKSYVETVKMANDMRIHAEGIYPKEMIEERRPSESLAVKNYREKIWKPITKEIFSKVITELNKIRRSSDWAIKYDDGKVPNKIADGESMKDYCESKYPFFGSVTNWVFKVLLSAYCKDANSIIAVMPKIDSLLPLNEYCNPFSHVVLSENVIDFVHNDYLVFKSTDKVIYRNGDIESFGDVYFIITTEKIQKWDQADGTKKFNLSYEFEHNIGILPAFRVEGLYKKAMDDTFIFESRLSSMIPRLDEALREYGDLQAEVVQHIFSQKWEIIGDDCGRCKGKGKVKGVGFNASETVCSECEGSGMKSRGPYSSMQLRAPMAGESNLPIPPAGYIQKDVEIVKIQDERIDKHIFKALSAINMEYLAETPLNESGKAKEVDKDSLNNFVHSIAEDLVSTMDKIYYFICEYRYKEVVQDNLRKEFLPYISVPEKFDLLSSTYLEDQLEKLKKGQGNPFIITQVEKDYVNKKFEGDNLTKRKVLLGIELDPLTGLSDDDKMTRLSNKGITLETYVISCNIQEYIARAVDDKGDSFYAMITKDQKGLLSEYAKEQIDSNSTAAIILDNNPT